MKLLAAIALIPLGGAAFAAPAERDATGIIVHDGWVLRGTDLARLARR